MSNDPVVSVWMITYKQEKYISQAIDSVLMQKTNFEYEIVIGEDCSTDKTREIVLEYKAKYRSSIKLLLQEKNVGMMQNFIDTFKACTGKYIALCEGDDYWTDPYKLQKQVDFLEKNPDYGMICSNFNRYIEAENKTLHAVFKRYENEVDYDEYLVDRSSIGTATVMIRADLLREYFDKISLDNILNWNIGDTPLWLYIARFSKIKVMKDVTAVYRVRPNSACHFKTPKERYEFRKKGFEVPFFFIEKFGAQKKTFSILNAKYIRNELVYYSETKDYQQAQKAFIQLRKLKAIKIKDFVLLFASLNTAANMLSAYFLSSISKVRNV